MDVPVSHWASGAKLVFISCTERGKTGSTMHVSNALANQSGLVLTAIKPLSGVRTTSRFQADYAGRSVVIFAFSFSS